MPHFKIKNISFLLAVLFLFNAKAVYAETKIEVFAVHSNIIKSWIQYSVKLDNEKFSGKNPVSGFRKRPGGSVRELSYFERRYYGIESQKVISDSSVEVTIKSIPSIIITIELKDEKVIPYVFIEGSRCVLTGVMIHAKKGALLSYTGYVEITGTDVMSGNTLKERIYKDK
ncbi:MAG: DUF4833 domain-containing protein [Spirochaetes bacterium]|nr:DUF4833 domain-containing protein [Spirochaetota bacterium]